MRPTKRLPLFIVSGASGVGKSTLCELLFQREREYIVLESDILWHEVYNTPEDEYRRYRQTQMTLCAHVAQIGKPVVLCGCATPKQFEPLEQRELFTSIHYLAVVCEESQLRCRLREGRKIEDKGWLESSLRFNAWLKENAARTAPPMQLLDTTGLSPEKTAARADAWVRARL
jgi:broad-specificity NMP kinase